MTRIAQAPAQATPANRLSIRIDSSTKELIDRAAVLKKMTTTDFAIQVLREEAQEVLKNDEILVLSDRDRDLFLAALDNPKAPNATLVAAGKRYREAREQGRVTSKS